MNINVFQKFHIFHRQFRYYPHEIQRKIHSSTARFRIAAGGARSGKSMAGGAEGALHLLFPDQRVWFVANTFNLADKEFDWCIEFLSRCELSPGKRAIEYATAFCNPARGKRSIYLPWGSSAETVSAAKPENLLGAEINIAIIGEASQFVQQTWDRQLRARLGSRQGGALLLSTPNWDSGFFRRMWDMGEDPSFPEYESWKFSVLANPTFPKEEYEAAKKTLDPVVFAEQYDGEFTSRRGRVFPKFSNEHIFDTMPDGFENWLVIRSTYHEKSSYNNPFVCLSIAINPKNKKMYVFDEFYKSQCLITDACSAISERGKGKRIVTTISDYFNPGLYDSLKKLLPSVTRNDEHKYTRRHAIVRKIQALQTEFVVGSDGPSIFVHRRCENVIRELTEIKWPEPKPEERDMAEDELPTTKNMACPMAIANAVAWISLASGNDIYTAQRPRRVA